MARITARNMKLFAGGRDISGRVNTSTLTFSSEAPDVTCFGDAYHERLSDGLKDYEVSFAGFGDFSACQIDATMQALMSSSAWYGWYPNAATASMRGREVIGVATNYTINGGVEGAIGYSATITGSKVMLDMSSLVYYENFSTGASTNLFDVDFLVANSGPCWHVFRLLTLTGTNPEITAYIQESADKNTWATIVSWEGASSANRIFAASSASCSRYRQAVVTLLGTSPSATFMISSGSAR